jgi:carbamoyl-phosphate synthase large subunit
MVKLAVAAMLGRRLTDMPYGVGLYPKMKFTAVKIPVFSGAKLTDVDIALGPEMKSTGEILGIDEDYEKAVYKGFLATGVSIPESGGVYVSLRDPEKSARTADILRRYAERGFALYASAGTAQFLAGHGLACGSVDVSGVKRGIASGKIDIVINVPKIANRSDSDSFAIRRYAIERNLPVHTCMDTAEAFLIAIERKKAGVKPAYRTLDEYIGRTNARPSGTVLA